MRLPHRLCVLIGKPFARRGNYHWLPRWFWREAERNLRARISYGGHQ